VARHTGRTESAVLQWRQRLGIRKSDPQRVRWTARHDELITRFSDAEVARRTGVARATIRKHRRQLGIVRFPPARPWTPADDGLLGTAPDDEVALKLGRS